MESIRRSRGRFGFPIPMRGNEFETCWIPVATLSLVPDPHEG